MVTQKLLLLAKRSFETFSVPTPTVPSSVNPDNSQTPILRETSNVPKPHQVRRSDVVEEMRGWARENREGAGGGKDGEGVDVRGGGFVAPYLQPPIQ